LNEAIVETRSNAAPGRCFRFDVVHDRLAQRDVEWRRALRLLEQRIRARAEPHQVIDRDDGVDLLRIDLLFLPVLVDELDSDEFRAVLIVPLEVNARAGLRVPGDDLKEFGELCAVHFEHDEGVFERQ